MAETATVEKVSKAVRSVRLAEKRMAAALEKIRLIGNLASSNYEFTDEQKQKMIDDLSNAIAEIEGSFEQHYATSKQNWHFDD